MNIVDDNLHVLFDTHFVDVLLADELLKILNTMSFGSGTHRSSLLFGDEDLVYRVKYKESTGYSVATPWDEFEQLLIVKQKLQTLTKETYNFCAIMKYPNGEACIKKHRDKEMSYGTQICGVSLGATRQFQLTAVDNPNHCMTLDLTHGSVYCLLPPTNTYWCHEILPSTTTDVRYSLTFRNQANPLRVSDLHFCQARFKTGKKKGQPCHAITLTDYCKRHTKK